ncbi:tripartite motif-containing protein 16-like protein isoform X2 [Xyrichtys novacula]|uniref:Tripartite motif-containing protein 16-like protein isoform X2 n=1 Tax=Xyrichtys novacula TaxID=13765 RepID=A0AAV1EQG9_XYRNO|nr:tripartite motif-containing protein 16-like protein isoform X2 [Xyrichtys novacula]
MHSLKRPRSPSEPGPSGSDVCKKHSRRLDVYCRDDKKLICEECASGEHNEHITALVKEERKRKQEELKSVQAKTQVILEKQSQKRRDMWKALETIEEESRATKDYCECVLADVIDSLQRHFMSVREVIDTQVEVAAAEVRTSLQTLGEKIKETCERKIELESELDCLAQADDISFLQKWPSVKHLCNQDASHPPEFSENLLPFETTKRVVEQLGRRLKEFCDEQFAAISQNGPPEEENSRTDQDVEPKTRAEFLQYACDLKFDPFTAHEDLIISEAGKVVKLSPNKTKISGPYPQQFLRRRQVLCKEGLQAERCYYEVEVAGDKVEIALTYKEIARKSLTNQSAFGANAMSWSLDCSTNYSVSHKGDSIQLLTPRAVNKIGVYLKFKEGTLSFYEVSDTMKLLHTVKDTFTKPLYPGFWLGEKCWIRICGLW